ncbi:MAG: hypothetical protein ACREFE_02825 [Limisphaerales bacterium]
MYPLLASFSKKKIPANASAIFAGEWFGKAAGIALNLFLASSIISSCDGQFNQSLPDMLHMRRRKPPTALGSAHCRRWNDWNNLNLPADMPMDPIHLSDDFRDFLICLNDAGVEYLVVGGHAVAYHGYVRPTRDMDIWVAVSHENAKRIVQAVKSFFGGELSGLSEECFLDPENVTRFGAVPNLIEIVLKISGGDFAKAYAQRIVATIDGQPANLINLSDLIANKKTSARLKDLADVEELTK